jgi:hypothetical protein
VLVLQPSKLPLHGRAAAVQGAPQGRAALDRRLRLNAALAERDHGRDGALVALVVDAVVVEAAIDAHDHDRTLLRRGGRPLLARPARSDHA